MSDTPLTHSDNQEPTAFTQAQLEWLPWLPPMSPTSSAVRSPSSRPGAWTRPKKVPAR